MTHGIGEVQDLLKENQSPVAEFNVGLVTAFSAIVREPADARTIQKNSETLQKGIIIDLASQVCPKLSQVQHHVLFCSYDFDLYQCALWQSLDGYC